MSDFEDRITKLMRDIDDKGANAHLSAALWSLARARDHIRAWVANPNDQSDDGILHFKPPKSPEVRFEWHPRVKRVYMIREQGAEETEGAVVHAEPIAYGVEDHGAAQNAVLIWMRGYNEGRCPHVGSNLIN